MSNQEKHTPGPWIVRRDGNVFDVLTQNGQGITACSCADNMDIKEDEANARLIAAAPELLDVLKMAYSVLKVYRDKRGAFKELVGDMENAIAKAQGGIK